MNSIIRNGNERINHVQTFTQGINVNQVLETTKTLLALEDACRELTASEQERRSSHEGAPLLAEPKVKLTQASANLMVNQPMDSEITLAVADGGDGEESSSSNSPHFGAEASLVGCIATLRQLLQETSMSELRARLQLINVAYTKLSAQGDKLMSALEASNKKYEDATANALKCNEAWQQAEAPVKNLTQQQESLQTQLAGGQQELTQMQQALEQAKSELQALPTPPKTPEQQKNHQLVTDKITALSNKLSAQQASNQQLSSQLSSLKGELSQAKQNATTYRSAWEKAANVATGFAQQSQKDSEAITKFINDAPRPPQIDGDRWESALTVLTLLTATLKQALNEDSIKSMRKEQEVMQKISEASRNNSEKQAKEAEEAQKKADEASKAASCVSKIIGYVMLAVSVVATIATAGAAAPLTTALAVVGIAMAVADIVLEETGHSNLMQMLSTQISTLATDTMVAFGVSKEDAKEIGGYLGMVLAAVAFLGVSAFSMSSTAKNIGQTVTNVAKTVSKQVTSVMKSVIKAVPRNFMNALTKVGGKTANLSKPLSKIANKADEIEEIVDVAKNADKASVNLRRFEIGMGAANMTMGVTSSAVSGGLNLHASSLMKDMKEMLAKMLLNSAAIEAIDELLKKLIASMSKDFDQINEMFQGMITGLNESGHVKADMYNQKFA